MQLKHPETAGRCLETLCALTRARSLRISIWASSLRMRAAGTMLCAN